MAKSNYPCQLSDTILTVHEWRKCVQGRLCITFLDIQWLSRSSQNLSVTQGDWLSDDYLLLRLDRGQPVLWCHKGPPTDININKQDIDWACRAPLCWVRPGCIWRYMILNSCAPQYVLRDQQFRFGVFQGQFLILFFSLTLSLKCHENLFSRWIDQPNYLNIPEMSSFFNLFFDSLCPMPPVSLDF